jgi:hypothetical protein
VCRQYHVIFGGDGEWDVADQEVQAGNFEGTGAAIGICEFHYVSNDLIFRRLGPLAIRLQLPSVSQTPAFVKSAVRLPAM